MSKKHVSKFNKFSLLMWKNWLLQRRKKKQTVLEIFFSVIFCILLVVIRDLAPSSNTEEPTTYEPFSISSLPSTLKPSQDSDLFTSVLNYFLTDSETNRRKRSLSLYRESFNESVAIQLPRIQKFLKDNPKSENVVKTILSETSVWIERKKRLWLKRNSKKRKKRFIDIPSWFDDPAWPVAYAPNNSAVQEIMGYISHYLYLDTEGYGFDTEEDMVDQLTSFSLDPERESNAFFGLEDVLGGIVFENDFVNGTLSEKIKYKIRLKGTPRSGKKRIAFAPPPRWNTELIYPVFQIPGPRNRVSNEGGQPGYYDEGFLAIQYAIDRGIADYLKGREIDSWASVQLQRMPYPPYIDDTYLVALQAWLPLILLLSYLYPAVNIVKSVVYEKENKLKESMKMMGLQNWLHWSAWFAKSFMFLLITTILITILLCTRWNGEGSLAVLDNSDPSLVFFFLTVYSCCTISFCFFMSTLFSKANSGATALGILWMFSYLPNIYLRPRFLSLSTRLKIGLCLYFNTGMSLGCFLTSMFEGTGSGIQWRLLASGVSPDSPFCLAHVLGVIIFDTIIYGLLTWYIEGVFPGEFGVPLPWNFPFTRQYWFGYSKVVYPQGAPPPFNDQVNFEPEPIGSYAGIRVKGLTKSFGKEKVAVNNMYLNMYQSQITALLGHNGAGKTTTMSMLTGLFPPTKGTAEVNGYDIVENMVQVRESIGICPQHDVLFDDLTVREHLLFFAQLKGMPPNEREEEVKYILNGIKLNEKSKALSKTLSGGMKRKLSVGIALCGRSRVVILDEPTSGMDPGARRVIWDLLQKERTGRTMLLTTHFMEEADLLGDRIAIMADGLVQCCGSSMFLKKIYGAGYHLTIVKERGCDVDEVTKLIKSYVPDAEMELNVAAELSYILPNEQVTKFELLFREFEVKKDVLKISSYGASQTTMEKVFLRVGEDTNPEVKSFLHKNIPDELIPPPSCSSHNSSSTLCVESRDAAADDPSPVLTKDLNVDENGTLLPPTVDIKIVPPDNASTKGKRPSGSSQFSAPDPRRQILHRNSGLKLILQQCWAMLVKKALYTFRNWGISLVQLLIPIFFLGLAMIILRNLPGINDNPPEFVASLSTYDGSETVIQNTMHSSDSKWLSSVYSERILENGPFNQYTLIGPNESISSYLLQKSVEDLPAFNLHWMTAIKSIEDPSPFRDLRVVTYFNNQPYHVLPLALNLVDVALVRASTNSSVSIATSNHPLPRTDTEKLTQESRQNLGFNIGFNLAFGMSFLAASFVLFVIKERSSKCKHLQFVSGVNFVIYWFAIAIWDTFCFMVTCLLIILCLFIYNEEGLSEPAQLGRIFVILLLYVWSILPFMYIASFFFEIPSSGFTRMSMIHTFIGMATLITVTILRIPDLELLHIADLLDWLFMLFPPYAMASAIGDLYSNVRFTQICSRDVLRFLCSLGTFENPCCVEMDMCGDFGCVYWTLDMFGWKKLGVGRMMTFMAVEGVVFYLIIAMIEMNFLRSLNYYVKSLYMKLRCSKEIDPEMSLSSTTEEDVDVRAERIRIQNADLEELFKTDKLILKDLAKRYHTGVLAVDHLNLGVPLGECFGLLGINGAGKTTTFKMLTGDLPVSHGDAYVNGYSVKKDIKKVQQQVGYCPQFDALLDQMTGRETLRMFARLRGVPEKDINECISAIAEQLLVTQHLDKEVGKYSGGNKRKISTGIALVGDPPLVLLDEPTSGMDPVARRHLWEVLNAVRDTGRCIILTSHSMEECEALCTRLAIMTNGIFQCLGSPQHLKSKFAEGYSIILRVSIEKNREVEDLVVTNMPSEMALVQDFILSTFKASFLREMQWGRLEYFIPVEAASWADVFGILECHKEELNIEDYSVTQTTLERVFLNFTRNQRAEKPN